MDNVDEELRGLHSLYEKGIVSAAELAKMIGEVMIRRPADRLEAERAQEEAEADQPSGDEEDGARVMSIQYRCLLLVSRLNLSSISFI